MQTESSKIVRKSSFSCSKKAFFQKRHWRFCAGSKLLTPPPIDYIVLRLVTKNINTNFKTLINVMNKIRIPY